MFHNPTNLFVAGFIGTPQMNFFRCRLEKDGEYYVLLGGRRIAISQAKQQRLTANGVQPQEITLGIRPEHVELSPDGFTGTVEVTEMMGSNTHLHVRFGEDEAVILVPDDEEPDREFAVGQQVQFAFSGDRIHLFSRDTEQNLERGS